MIWSSNQVDNPKVKEKEKDAGGCARPPAP